MRELLSKIRDKIAQGWCTGKNARTFNGSGCDAKSPFACCWCLEGAIQFVSPDYATAVDLENVIIHHINKYFPGNWPSIPAWNDFIGRTQEEVLALLDRIIAERK